MDGTTVAIMELEDAYFNLKVTHTYLLGHFFSWMYYLYSAHFRLLLLSSLSQTDLIPISIILH